MIAILLILIVAVSPIEQSAGVVSIEFPSMAVCETVRALGRIKVDGETHDAMACVFAVPPS